MTQQERAYRRGALQGIQFLRRMLDTIRPEDYPQAIAAWEQQLIMARDKEDAKYLGTYLDQCAEAFFGIPTTVVGY